MAETFKASGYNTYAQVTGPLLPETGILRGFDSAHHRQAYRVPFFGWRADILEAMRSYVEPWLMLLHIWEVHRPFRSPPDFAKRSDRAGYEAALTATDEWLGPVFEALTENTIVAITGDHGEEYAESRWDQLMIRAARKARATLKLSKWLPYADRKLAAHAVGHGFALHEHLVRVPLIMAGPGVPNALIDDQVRHIDLFPSLAELCEVPLAGPIDGRSLWPLARGASLPGEPAYMEAVGVKLEGRRIAGARTPDWKLLKEGQGRPTLLKLESDGPVNEKRDVYKSHPDVAKSLEAFIERVWESASNGDSGMTQDEEAVVEQHLRDLGYL